MILGMLGALLAAPNAHADQLDAYIGDLGKENTQAQTAAAYALLAQGKAAHSKLLGCLSNSNAAARSICLTIIKRVKEPADFDVIARLAQNDGDYRVREKAIE